MSCGKLILNIVCKVLCDILNYSYIYVCVYIYTCMYVCTLNHSDGWLKFGTVSIYLGKAG